MNGRQRSTMEEIQIRKAGKSDFQKLLPIMNQSAEAKLKTLDIDSLFEDNICGSKHLPASIYVGDTSDGNILGYLLSYYGYSTRVGRIVVLEDVFVLPECRRRGIASALLKEMLKEALAFGCSMCNMCTTRPSEFFQTRGFVLDAEDLAFKMESREMVLFAKKCSSDLGEFILREAIEADCQELAKVVKGLYEYLNIPEAMEINDKDFMRDGFGSQPFFKCYVVERDNHVVGYTLFFSTWHLDGPGVYMEDLYMSQDCRGKGVGTALWKLLVKDCLTSGAKECSFTVDYRNTPSIEIYKHKGANDMTDRDGSRFYHLNKEDMEKICK